MLPLTSITRDQIDRATEIARTHGVHRLVLFGSAAEHPGTARDLDIGGIDGWELWRLAAELEEALELPVDVVPLEPGTPFTRYIEEEGEVLFAR